MVNMVEFIEGEPIDLGLSSRAVFTNWYLSVSIARRALNELGFYRSDISKMCRETGRAALSKCLYKLENQDELDYWPNFIEVSSEPASDNAKRKVHSLAESNMYAVSDELVVWATGGSLFIGQIDIIET